MPKDAELDNDFNWFDTDRLIPKLDNSKSRNILIVADSCYSGTITRDINEDMSNLRDNIDDVYLFESMLKKRTRFAITSGGDEPVLDSGIKDNSIFNFIF